MKKIRIYKPIQKINLSLYLYNSFNSSNVNLKDYTNWLDVIKR